MKYAIAFGLTLLTGTAAFAGSQAVSIKGFAFNAAEITISTGDSVIWTNQDGAPHTATAENGAFNSGTLKKGGSVEIKFTQAGTYDYVCKFHPNMKGRVVVN